MRSDSKMEMETPVLCTHFQIRITAITKVMIIHWEISFISSSLLQLKFNFFFHKKKHFDHCLYNSHYFHFFYDVLAIFRLFIICLRFKAYHVFVIWRKKGIHLRYIIYTQKHLINKKKKLLSIRERRGGGRHARGMSS